MRLSDRTAIITGASRGIGRAIAEAFVREGARVVLVSRRQEALDGVAAELESVRPGAAVARACHMGDPEQVRVLVESVTEDVGVPDILVNNAATNPYFGPILGTERSAWDKTFEVNLLGAFELSRAVAGRLVEMKRPGSIINVASIAGLGAAPFQGVYGMTKAALVSMTQTMARELGGAGIRVNAIAPGLVETRLASALVSNDALVKHYTDRAALGRYGQPEEIAGPAVFLASDESSFITGHVLVADGGFLPS